MKQKIISIIRQLTGHSNIEITTRGNTAIKAALTTIPKNKRVLIPEEGGWLTYRTIPKELGIKVDEVKCNDAKINVSDLHKKLETKKYGALLYQNPGGYFAEQNIKKIHQLCKLMNCLVILDVSGSIGTEMSNGKYADILVCSFGRWKLVEARGGGFISANNTQLWKSIKDVELLEDEPALLRIQQKLEELPERISFLEEARDAVLGDLDLESFDIIHPNDQGLVVLVRYHHAEEKHDLLQYCKDNDLPYTECPRYIRLNDKAISIEIKRLQKKI
jgi:hypothetical protein